MKKNIEEITLFLENSKQYILSKDKIINFGIEGIKKSIQKFNDSFTEFVECEHFILEIKKDDIENLDDLQNHCISGIGMGKQYISMPYREDVDNASLNSFQEIYISKNDIMYIMVSIVKNFSDCYNYEMINDSGYIQYMLGGKSKCGQ